MPSHKNLFKTVITLLIVLSSIGFYYPAQAGITSAIQALSKGKVTKTLKVFTGGVAHGASKKVGETVGEAAVAYLLTQVVQLPDGREVRVCQYVYPNGYRSNPYYCN